MTALVQQSVIKQILSPELKPSPLRFVCSAVSLSMSAGREGRGSGPLSVTTVTIPTHDESSIGIDFEVERSSNLSVQLGEREHHMTIKCCAQK